MTLFCQQKGPLLVHRRPFRSGGDGGGPSTLRTQVKGNDCGLKSVSSVAHDSVPPPGWHTLHAKGLEYVSLPETFSFLPVSH